MKEIEVTELRELYFLEGIRDLPKILELADRNRLSPSYGCFDRDFWHYRTTDFPSGMAQEAVLPLALAYLLDHPKNPYYKKERLKELVFAGIDFARRFSHPDGSTDDYFPYERAVGAAAFSLYACTEAHLLLGLEEGGLLDFYRKRAAYLASSGYEESGVLSNHRALIVLALYNVFLLTGDLEFKKEAEGKLNRLLSLQTNESWFPEYEGCDPGYLTFTIDFLAKYYVKSKDERVVEPLRRAIAFSSFFIHPDGTYGGEYGSRNTFHFLPHGFELMGELAPEALPVANLFLEGLRNGRRSFLDDDRVFCHYPYNFLQAYLDFCPRRNEIDLREREAFTQLFQEAGLIVRGSKRDYAVISTAKGGVAKIYREGELCYSDTGFVGQARGGKRFISHVIAPFKWELEGNRVLVEGSCYEHEAVLFSPFLFLLFRAFLFFLGRFLPANFVRSLLQRKAILKKKKKFPLSFKKEIPLDLPGEVTCHFFLDDPEVSVEGLWISSDATFIYVATSQSFQPGNLKLWVNLASILPLLNEKREASFRLPLE